MISMINMNLDLQIQDVVVVNWAALIRVIDAIGGIYLDITPEEVEKGYITGYITEIEEATGIWQPQLTQAGYQLCMVYMQLHIVVTVIRQVWIWEEQAVSVR